MESSHARVLVAEDSRSQRAYFVDLLRAEGLDVHEAHDGRVTLDLCRIICPDLLILDLASPRPERSAGARADRKIRATPVVVLTADEREATVSAVLDAGATDFLVKPVRPSGRPFAVAIVDVDRFKSVNDRYGRAAGDQVLCAIAGPQRSCPHGRLRRPLGGEDSEQGR
jgi:PleD family two-component response regulator